MFAKIFGNVSKESIKRQKTCFRFTACSDHHSPLLTQEGKPTAQALHKIHIIRVEKIICVNLWLNL